MITTLSLPDFIHASKDALVIDVRTPAEFEQGHIIGATNLPLFTNDERVLVGTCYKQQGRQPAILLGFELIGGRWADYIRDVESLLAITQNERKKVFVHCWRGGMRSGAMAWALTMYGFDVYVLKGGYKTYRRYCVDTFETRYPIIILSGKTGCAKTATLLEMKKLGEQVIDLEGLAHHQGSSFGSKGNDYQPSQEQFENTLAHELRQLDTTKRIWFENESIVIGRREVPRGIFEQMRKAQIIDMQLPIEERVDFLNDDYGVLDHEFLKESVLKITKRLGPNETKLSLQAIDENRMKDFIRQVLVYYDKTYQRSQEKRDKTTIHSLSLNTLDPQENAKILVAHCTHLFGIDVAQFLPAIQTELSQQSTTNLSYDYTK